MRALRWRLFDVKAAKELATRKKVIEKKDFWHRPLF